MSKGIATASVQFVQHPAAISGDGNSTSIDLLHAEGPIAFAHAAVVSAGALTGKMQHADVVAGPFTDAPGLAFTPGATGVVAETIHGDASAGLKRWVRYNYSLAGGDAEAAVVAVFQRKSA